MYLPEWSLNQANLIKFVLVDVTNNEVMGLGDNWTLEIDSPANPAGFVPGTGVKSERGGGWYQYVATAAEAAVPGVVAIKVTGPGIVQQNLEYVIKSRVVGLCEFPYLVTDADTGDPLQGVRVEVSTDANRGNIIWSGYTDAFGQARDQFQEHPFLPVGTVYFWRYRSGYVFDNPDIETVSAS